MFEEIKSKFGGVDVCVNNAGVGSKDGALLTGSTEGWRNMLDVGYVPFVSTSSLSFREQI